MPITIFDTPVAEFKTRKAAIKYSNRVTQKTKVVKCYKSAFDPLYPIGKPIYQVILTN